MLEQLGYQYDNQSMIWKSSDYEAISYSDGDHIENAISMAIKSTVDKSVLSMGLKHYCVDWPSTYHLSSLRANILRPYEKYLSGDILEIGAGCGAITRYLGECGANVIALEGSIRRAEIAKARTSDLDNVHVLAEKFHQFQPTQQFDVITLIGVLEYSNLFIPSESPTLSVLEKARSLLKPGGKLFVAIENQFGLKYFAGANEDHLNVPMYGIEGRYEKNQPETFGKEALSRLMSTAGFQFVEFMAPFPDYKFPTSIITESGFTDPTFDASALAWQSALNDPQLPKYLSFSIELAWPKIFENRLGLELSNSFLICASPEKSARDNILAYHYTADRKAPYCKELIIQRDDDNGISVNFKKLCKHSNEETSNNGVINFKCPEKQSYIHGKLLSLELISILKKDDWAIEQVSDFVKRYLSIVSQITNTPIPNEGIIDKNTSIPNWCFDLIPQNILITDDGTPKAIDVEWYLSKPMPIGYLLFRAIINIMNKISRFGLHVHRHPFTRRYFLFRAISDAGVDITDSDIDEYTHIEAIIQHNVTGRLSEHFLNWRENELLNTDNLGTRSQNLQNEMAELSKLAESSSDTTDFKNEIEKIKLDLKGINDILKEIVDVQKQVTEISKAALLNSERLIDRSEEENVELQRQNITCLDNISRSIELFHNSLISHLSSSHQEGIKCIDKLTQTMETAGKSLAASISVIANTAASTDKGRNL